MLLIKLTDYQQQTMIKSYKIIIGLRGLRTS